MEINACILQLKFVGIIESNDAQSSQRFRGKRLVPLEFELGREEGQMPLLLKNAHVLLMPAASSFYCL